MAPLCEICQTSYGLSVANLRAIVVMTVLAGVSCLLCYIGVLWFAIRTRFTADQSSLVITPGNAYVNMAFDSDELKIENKIVTIRDVAYANTAEPATIIIQNDQERF